MNMQNDHEKTCSMALPERLESLCDRFESAWVAGRRPALEDFLAQVEEADRSALLRELLGLELEYRARLGDRLTSAEYRQRLPGYEQLVEDAFVTLAPTSFAASAPSKPVMVLSTPQLLEALQQYQLLDAGRLEELARTLPAPLPEPAVLAGDLVRRSWLTFYQADQLLHGNGSHLVLGSYVLLERMGEGGMGTVYKARHRPMDRIVAVKIIKSERLAQRDALRRFQREVRALAQLSHPNIVTAYDADRAGERSFLVMEHVEGLDLHRLVRESGPLTPVQACEYVRQAALGLQHASERGLVHRDVKPSNLLLDREQSIIKLLDLGLARREGVASATVPGELTGVGMMLGTPDFMAPEQAVDPRQADIRADIYSLGCTLYFLLAGRPPFPDGTLTQKLLWHQHAEPEPIGSLRPDVPAGLSAVLRKMLAKRPEERYQAPAEVAAALAPFANANLAKPLTDATELSLSSADAAALPQVGKLLKHVGKMLVLQGRPEAPPSEDATAAMSQATAKGKPTPLEKKQVAKILKRVGKMLVQMGKLLAVLLVVVGVYLFYFRSESADQFQTRVRDLIRQEKYQEALEQIDASRQDEGIKTPLQKEVRDQALAWADLRLKQQEDAKQVSELMAALRQRFSDDREVTDRLIAALQVVAKLQVEELQAAQRLKDALNLLKQSEFATTQWALAAKKNLLTRWTGEAAALLQEKDFDKADQVAQDILDQEPAYPAAFTIRQQAAKATAAVNSKVDELVNKKEFAAAAKHVKDHWPRAQDRFRAKILPGWYAVVAEERNKKERDKATATLADLKAHYPE
ncbi:MAG TPA: protein kinase, partial [Gemmataceae bacterium]|nr:protein kinase [Gemmataceae bacterium]